MSTLTLFLIINWTYTLRTLSKETILDKNILGLLYVPFEFQSKYKNWVVLHCIVYQTYKCFYKNPLLLGLISAPKNLFLNYEFQLDQLSKLSSKGIANLSNYFIGGVIKMGIPQNSKDLWANIQSKTLSSCNSIKHLNFLHFKQV